MTRDFRTEEEELIEKIRRFINPRHFTRDMQKAKDLLKEAANSIERLTDSDPPWGDDI